MWCRQKKSQDCKNFNDEKLRSVLKWGCQSIRDDIQIICSERDSLFGLNEVREMELLLEFSHVLGLADQGRFQRKCLKRFKEVFKGQEISNDHLLMSTQKILENLRKKGSRYLQESFSFMVLCRVLKRKDWVIF